MNRQSRQWARRSSYCGNSIATPPYSAADPDFVLVQGQGQTETEGQTFTDQTTDGAGKLSVRLRCRDYGGSARPVVSKGVRELQVLYVPFDPGEDGIADGWQYAQLEAWNAQYDLMISDTEYLDPFWPYVLSGPPLSPGSDHELADPDGVSLQGSVLFFDFSDRPRYGLSPGRTASESVRVCRRGWPWHVRCVPSLPRPTTT